MQAAGSYGVSIWSWAAAPTATAMIEVRLENFIVGVMAVRSRKWNWFHYMVTHHHITSRHPDRSGGNSESVMSHCDSYPKRLWDDCSHDLLPSVSDICCYVAILNLSMLNHYHTLHIIISLQGIPTAVMSHCDSYPKRLWVIETYDCSHDLLPSVSDICCYVAILNLSMLNHYHCVCLAAQRWKSRYCISIKLNWVSLQLSKMFSQFTMSKRRTALGHIDVLTTGCIWWV